MPMTKKGFYLHLAECEARGGLSIKEKVTIVVRESESELKMVDSNEHHFKGV